MSRFHRVGMLLAGYGLALLAATLAVRMTPLHTQGPDAQAAAGMFAFGDALLFAGVFGAVALVPTALAVRFAWRVPGARRYLVAGVAIVAALGLLALTLLAAAGPRPPR